MATDPPPDKPATLDAYIETVVPPQHRATAQAVRDLLRACAPAARESFAYNMPVWIGRRIVAYLNSSREGIALSFVHGTALADPDRLLRGRGKTARYLRLRRVDDVAAHTPAIEAFMHQALALDGDAAGDDPDEPLYVG